MPMKTVEVLLALLERRGEIVTKDELLKAAWPDSIVEEANLTVHVALLRKTLGQAAAIETIPKRGYRLLAEPAARRRDGGGAPVPARRFSAAAISGTSSAGRSLEKSGGGLRGGLAFDTGLRGGGVGTLRHAPDAGPVRLQSGSRCVHGGRATGSGRAPMRPESPDAQASFAFSQLFDLFGFRAAERRSHGRGPWRRRASSRICGRPSSTRCGATPCGPCSAAREATAIDPISLKAVVGSGFHLYLTQQYEPDLEPLLKALELEPEFAVAHWALGLACDRLGDFERAQAAHRAR